MTGLMTETSFGHPRTSNSFRAVNMAHDESLPIELNQRSTVNKDVSDDFKVVYKSPRYMNKSKVKKLERSFVPKTNKDYDNVSPISTLTSNP